MAKWERSAVVIVWFRVRILLVWLVWIFAIPSGVRERSFCIFRRIHVWLPLACQVSYESFSFTPVPGTDLKHFSLESSLGRPWLPGKLSLGGLDYLQDPESHGPAPARPCDWGSGSLSLSDMGTSSITDLKRQRQTVWILTRILLWLVRFDTKTPFSIKNNNQQRQDISTIVSQLHAPHMLTHIKPNNWRVGIGCELFWRHIMEPRGFQTCLPDRFWQNLISDSDLVPARGIRNLYWLLQRLVFDHVSLLSNRADFITF